MLGNLVMVLNLLSGIIGGVWLLYLSQWKVLLACVLSAAFADSILMWPLMFSLVFSIPGAAAEKRGDHRTLMFWAAITIFYKTLLMIGWASFSLVALSNFAAKNELSVIPFLLCSYGVATTPWASMAQKELNESGFNPAANMVLYLSIAYFFAMVAKACGATNTASIAIISFFTLVGCVITFIEAMQIEQNRRFFRR